MSKISTAVAWIVNRWPRSMRGWVLVVLPAIVIILMSFGPSGWREPAERVLYLAWMVIAVSLTHICRKALHNREDSRTAWIEAMKGNVGAAIVFLALTLLEAALFYGFSQAAHS